MRNNKIIKAMLAGLVLAVALPAPGAAQAASFESGFYLGFGYGEFRDDSEIVARSDSDKLSKFIFGYQFNDWLGIEGGLMDFDGLRYQFSSGDKLTVDNKSWYATANIQIPIYRNEQELVGIYLAGGGHRWDTSQSLSDSAGTIISTVREHDTGSMYGGGVIVRGRNAAWRFSYEVVKKIGTTTEIDLGAYSLNLLFYF